MRQQGKQGSRRRGLAASNFRGYIVQGEGGGERAFDDGVQVALSILLWGESKGGGGEQRIAPRREADQ